MWLLPNFGPIPLSAMAKVVRIFPLLPLKNFFLKLTAFLCSNTFRKMSVQLRATSIVFPIYIRRSESKEQSNKSVK